MESTAKKENSPKDSSESLQAIPHPTIRKMVCTKKECEPIGQIPEPTSYEHLCIRNMGCGSCIIAPHEAGSFFQYESESESIPDPEGRQLGRGDLLRRCVRGYSPMRVPRRLSDKQASGRGYSAKIESESESESMPDPERRSLGRGSLLRRRVRGYSPMIVPGQSKKQAAWKHHSKAPPGYQMQQYIMPGLDEVEGAVAPDP